MKKEVNEVFSELNLPTGESCSILEGKGIHYFEALSKSKGDSGLLIKFLIVELCVFNGVKNKIKHVEEMHLRDISYLSEVIGLMLSNDFK